MDTYHKLSCFVVRCRPFHVGTVFDMDFDHHLQTYLSPDVYSLLCEVGVDHCERDTGEKMSDVLTDGLLNWSAMSSELLVAVNSREGYIHRVQVLAPIFNRIYCYYAEMSTADFEVNYGKYFTWMAEPSKVVRCFDIAQHETNTAANHALLIITSVLEHALGDVVLLRASRCPSLLRDLLMMKELEDLLSHSVVQLLQTLMGPPVSLNLRNVVWHGFPRPGELGVQYVYVMLCVTASIGKLLEDLQIYAIPHRNMFQITVPTLFSDVDLSQLNDVAQLFAHSNFVAPSVAQFWHLSLELFASCQYGECVVVLLPQLELALRRVFVAVNECPDRILTAENTVLYTTLDEMLNRLLPDGSENRLISDVGKPYITLLLDCFHYPLGPRLRDHISHGEVLLMDMSKDLALHLICICVAFASKFCSPDTSEKSVELVQSICSKADNYESVYHPISVVKQQTFLAAKSLSRWHLMPQPLTYLAEGCTEDFADETKHIQTQTETASRAIENYITVLSAKEKIDKSDCYQLLVLDDFSAQVEKALRSLQLNTLYRYHNSTLPTREEEILRLLLRIGKLCVRISEQILDVAENRHKLLQTKQLRSRQRTNYKKFLTSTVAVSVTLRLIVVIILITVTVLDDLEHEAVKQQRLVKLFKHVLKFCENMLSYTGADVNKWDEAQTASNDLSNRVQFLKLSSS